MTPPFRRQLVWEHVTYMDDTMSNSLDRFVDRL